MMVFSNEFMNKPSVESQKSQFGEHEVRELLGRSLITVRVPFSRSKALGGSLLGWRSFKTGASLVAEASLTAEKSPSSWSRRSTSWSLESKENQGDVWGYGQRSAVAVVYLIRYQGLCAFIGFSCVVGLRKKIEDRQGWLFERARMKIPRMPNTKKWVENSFRIFIVPVSRLIFYWNFAAFFCVTGKSDGKSSRCHKGRNKAGSGDKHRVASSVLSAGERAG